MWKSCTYMGAMREAQWWIIQYTRLSLHITVCNKLTLYPRKKLKYNNDHSHSMRHPHIHNSKVWNTYNKKENKRLAKISDRIKSNAGKYLQTEGDICLCAYSIGYCNRSSGSFAWINSFHFVILLEWCPISCWAAWLSELHCIRWAMWSMTHCSMRVLIVTTGASWIHALFICWQNWKICNILITLSVTKTVYTYLSLQWKSQFPMRQWWCEMWGVHSNTKLKSQLLGYETVYTGKWLPTICSLHYIRIQRL